MKGKWVGIPLKERWQDPKWREFMKSRLSPLTTKRNTGRVRTEESKKKTSESIKKWHAQMTKEEKEARRKKLSEAVNNLSDEEKEDRRRKLSESNKKAYINDPTLLDRVKQGVKRSFNNGTERKKYLSEVNRKRWQDPEERRKQSERIKAYYASEEGLKRRQEQAEKTRCLNKGKKFSKEHRQRISDSISKGITEGKGNGYFTSSKRGIHNSPKAGEVYYRSAYEWKAFLILDADESVLTYQHDACRVKYKLNGNQRYYILDLIIDYKDGTQKFVEIKPKDFLGQKDVIKKIEAAQAFYGDKFEVWSEKELGITDPHKLYDELKAEIWTENELS